MGRTRTPPSRSFTASGAAALLALAAVTGCATPTGGSTDPDAPVTSPDGPVTPGPSTPAPATPDGSVSADLVIELDETGSGSVMTFTLTCDPVGGSHPDAEAACAALEQPGALDAFEPVPRDVACTEQWGGPQVATVTGTVDGTTVRSDLSRTNGCEIARWDALAVVLANPGGA